MRRATSTHSGAARATRVALTAALLAIAPLASGGAPGKAAPARPAADSYPLRAQVRVRASPVLDRDVDGEAVATISPGTATGTLRVHLESNGYGCDLEARRSGQGELAFAPGQRCVADVSEPTARGRAEATLRSGSGRLSGDRLALELAFDLGGTMSVHVEGRTMEVLGQRVELPAGWTPALPLRGTATASAEGRRGGVARAE